MNISVPMELVTDKQKAKIFERRGEHMGGF